MKNSFVLLAFLAIFAACSNPLLKWIDTPKTAYSDSDKAITGFSLGFSGEVDVILANPHENAGDKTPITVILPAGAVISDRTPSVEIIGDRYERLSATADRATYRVYARDGSYRDYEVEFIYKTRQSAEIKWFDLELPDGTYMAEGTVVQEENGGEITILVPSGTDLTRLTAKIVQTGVSIRADVPGPQSASSDTAATLTGNFSNSEENPVRYKVRAADGSEKIYTVRVMQEKSSARAITDFYFEGITVSGSAIIAGTPQSDGTYPIVITVPPKLPDNTPVNLGALTPKITHTGRSLAGEQISSDGGPGTVTAGGTVDFTDSVPYTVSSEDDHTREYVVTVLVADRNSGKQITGFYIFPNTQGAEGVSGIINETAGTIAVTVPAGTDLRNLRPAVYHTGDSVSPISGAPVNFSNSVAQPVRYTVTALDKSTRTYMVSVFLAARSDKAITALDFSEVSDEAVVIGGAPGTDGKYPIVVTVPTGTNVSSLTPVITHTGHSLTGAQISSDSGPGTVSAGGTVNFSNSVTTPVPYTVTAEDKSSRVYTVTVIARSGGSLPGARIDAFYFNNPPAIGTINQTAGTIAVTVPWDTNLTTLVPSIHFTGAKIRLGSNPADDVTDNPAHIGADFSYSGGQPVSVSYTVTAVDTTTKPYQVTVTLAERPKSSAREITALTFDEILDKSKTTTVIASMADSSGRFPIEVTVPTGTVLDNLTPVITYTGASIARSGFSDTNVDSPQPKTTTGTLEDFSDSAAHPVIYTVTPKDNAIEPRNYAVTVRVDDNNAKKITGFYFTDLPAVGVIKESDHTITVQVPYGTDLSGLVPTVYYDGISVDPLSNRPHNFSSRTVYTVRARNGTVQPYTVTVQPVKNSAKEISAISFPNVGVLDTVIGAVPNPDGEIPISVTVSGNTTITTISSLRPKITHTGASISPPGGTAQVSNPYTDSPRDFSTAQSYRITAEDGSTKDYSVSVHIAGNAVITGFVFKPADNSGIIAVQAVGAINQTEHTIHVVLPHSTAIGNLTPTITYIGTSITPIEGTARNFTGSDTSPLTYTVTAQDATQNYAVTVTVEEEIPEISVTFQEITDPDLLTASFNQSTGIIRLDLGTGGEYTSPYEWRLDGIKLNVSGTAPFLELHTSGLTPGQHEIVVTVTKTGVPAGYPAHYTNKVYFLVQE